MSRASSFMRFSIHLFKMSYFRNEHIPLLICILYCWYLQPLENVMLAAGVLGASMLIEGVSLLLTPVAKFPLNV